MRTTLELKDRIKALLFYALLLLSAYPLKAHPISLQALVTPSTVIIKDGRLVPFAVHGFIEFNSLRELFPYIDSQAQRWKTSPDFDETARRNLRRDLLQRGIESRVISVLDLAPARGPHHPTLAKNSSMRWCKSGKQLRPVTPRPSWRCRINGSTP